MTNSRLLLGLILIIIGISSLSGFPIFSIIFPIIIIWIGFKILTGQNRRTNNWHNKTTEDRNNLDEVLVFSGINKKIKSSDFQNGRVVTIFGGADIDLSDVKTSSKTIDFETVAVLGGIRIRIPENWRVQSNVTSILGGFDDKTQPDNKGSQTLQIRGSTVLGGIEVLS